MLLDSVTFILLCESKIPFSPTITLDGSSFTIEKLVAIARDNEKAEFVHEALEHIKVFYAMLDALNIPTRPSVEILR